ncbi:hypothetical protein OKW49_000941 [Paraburkholderia youngii]
MLKKKAKLATASRKISPSFHVLSRQRSPKGLTTLKKPRKTTLASVPKTLTLVPPNRMGTFEGCRALRGHEVPQNLTFARTPRIRRFLNPLTFHPGPAHRAPRTSSLEFPADPHQVSRKASPCRAESPARQGFAEALTFLTRFKGVYFYYSQALKPASPVKHGSYNPQPPVINRETVRDPGRI